MNCCRWGRVKRKELARTKKKKKRTDGTRQSHHHQQGAASLGRGDDVAFRSLPLGVGHLQTQPGSNEVFQGASCPANILLCRENGSTSMSRAFCFLFFHPLPSSAKVSGAPLACGPFSRKQQLGHAVVYHTALVTSLGSLLATLPSLRLHHRRYLAVSLQVAIINSYVNTSRGCRFHLARSAHAAEQRGKDNKRVKHVLLLRRRCLRKREGCRVARQRVHFPPKKMLKGGC